jgi:tetratricopeptide (TPR) repeat protein
VIAGQHYFSSRSPKDYGKIETPTVTAAIRGTEFAVDVAANGTTTITMIEGIVDASNQFGRLQVAAGEQAFIEPGHAPTKRVVVRPRDAVSWSLYYPRVLGGADAARLGRLGAAGQDLARASELLAVGQVGEATALIGKAREAHPNDPLALALASIVDLVADRKTEALDGAKRAVEADPSSSTAALALSFAEQAHFDIAKAREMAESAARLDPESAEAQARVAELRLAEGDVEGAREAADRAVRRDPGSARALAVLGFVQLAQLRSKEALASFEQAVAADPSFPLAHLGLGIARLRSDLRAGREEIQTAVILDPEISLYRSYLSKAYFEERRPGPAEKELAAAKELDPEDPTPWLYSAILKRTYNRPVEGLHELDQSIERNDRRAVYRSRLLLDEDLAVRSADLAGIYNDLGFDQLGMVTARQSADFDQSNYSSHLFLSGTYRNLPGFSPAFLSETLQSRIYQPVSVNAVRPDTVNESVSFNEYTALFDRPRLRGFASLRYGDTDTDLPTALDSLELDNSSSQGGDATVTFNQDRLAGAVSYQKFTSDGFRVNNDIDNDAIRAFVVLAPSQRDQLQLNVIDGTRDTGDLPLRDFPVIPNQERLSTDLTNVGLGYHRILSPASDLAISAIYNDAEQTGSTPLLPDLSSKARLEGTQLEGQYVRRQSKLTWTGGAGYFDGEQEITSIDSGVSTSLGKGDDQYANGYVYAKFRELGPVELTAGLSYEDVTAPVGLLPPRDSQIQPAAVLFEDNQISPKLGLSARLAPKTVLRATAYSRLTPAIGRLQTLEPTQVAGFNQFFDDPGGTNSKNYGIGLDQQFSSRVFLGFSALRRDLEIPEADCASPDPDFRCIGQVASGVVERTSDDWLGNVYVNGTVGKTLALGLDYAYEERDFDFTEVDNLGAFNHLVRTHRVRPEARFFLPMGFFATARATYYDQHVDQVDPAFGAGSVDSDFWIGDVGLGYRLPERWGSVTLTALNVTDREFVFYRSSLEENVVPARAVLLSLSFTSP